MGDKYEQSGLKRMTKLVKLRNGRTKEVTTWRGYLRYRAPNPKYLEPPSAGETDTRTQTQRRKTAWLEVTTTFDPESVRTEKQARDELSKWKDRMNREAAAQAMPGANATVGEYVSAYVDSLEASQSVSRRTVHGYRTIAKRIDEGLPEIHLRDLTTDAVQAWEGKLIRKGLSPATVTKYHRLLSEACKHAVNVDVLAKNPCQAVRTPKAKPPSPNSLTAGGYARLAVTLDALEPTDVVIAATIAMHTGLREGEVCGLRWCAYDPQARTLRVEESIGRAGGESFSNTPKTASSRRIVPVSPQLAAALERRRDAMKSELQVAQLTMRDRDFQRLYITGTIDGRWSDPIQISRKWKNISEALGLIGTRDRAVTFHDLRHSFATRAIAAGADVKAVAAVLGHTNAAITLNVYADADPESKRRASELIAKAIAAQGELEPYAVRVLKDGTPDGAGA